MNDIRHATKIYTANLHQKQPKGRTKARWKEDDLENMQKMGIVKWKQVAKDRRQMEGGVREVIIFLG
jgi:hypothetical protein